MRWTSGTVTGTRRPTRQVASAEAVEPRRLLAVNLVADLNANTASSSPPRGTEFNGAYYFVADDGVTGTGLWKSDGTAAGTQLLANVPRSSPDAVSPMAHAGDLLFFSTAEQLWRTDGTPSGTTRVGNVSVTSKIAVVNGVAYFAGRDPARPEAGYELYRSDGTAAGTTLVKDIFPGLYPGSSNVANSLPSHLVAFNGRLYFFAASADSGMELWQSDGTEAGTTLVKDINPGRFDSNQFEGLATSEPFMTVAGDTLYFSAEGGAAAGGRELYKSDGTPEGTVRVKDIHPSSSSAPSGITPFGDGVAFAANGPEGGRELWKSDGTEAGTVLVKDVIAGRGSNPMEIVNAGGMLFFAVGNGPGSAMQVYKSDGTAEGTVPLTSTRGTVPPVVPQRAGNHPQIVAAGPGEPRVFFVGSLGASGTPLWTSDGTPEGTGPVADAAGGAPVRGSPFMLTGLPGGRALFGGIAPATGVEPYLADGATATARLIKDVNTTTLDTSFAGVFSRRDGTLLLAARDATGWGIWRSDGTPAGTSLLKRVTPGVPLMAEAGDPQFTEAGGFVYFVAHDPNAGAELWRTDGTPDGTIRVADVNPGSASSAPKMLTALGDSLVFWARTDEAAYEPWRTDGTEAGTVMLKDIWPGPTDSIGYAAYSRSVPAGRAVYEGLLYFSAEEQVGAERVASVWRTDGTPAGTVRLIDPTDITAPRYPDHFTTSGEKLFFSAESLRPVGSTVSGLELYVIDATGAAPRLVKEINDRNRDANPRELTDVNGTLYFMAAVPYTPTHSASFYTLWRSDGTDAGTVRVPNGDPSAFLYGEELTSAGGTLYFRSATHNGSSFANWELYKTDPSRSDAERVIDLNPGANSSTPTQLTASGRYLYFVATTPGSTSDVWRTDGTEAGTVKALDFFPGLASDPMTAHLTAGRDGTAFVAGDSTLYGYELWRMDLSGAVLGGDGTLTVTGTDAADTISVRRAAGGNVIVDVNGQAATFSAAGIRRVNIDALGGADTVTVDGGLALSGQVLTHVDGGEGGATVNYYGSPISDNIIFTSADTVEMVGGVTTFESVGRINLFGLGGSDHFSIHPDAPVGSVSGDAGDDSLEWRGTDGDDRYTLAYDQLQRNWAPARSIALTNVEDVTLSGLGGNDRFDIGTVPAGNRLRLHGGAGDDDFRFGGAAALDMSVMLGPVEVSGGAGSDAVSFLDARFSPADLTYTLNDQHFIRPAYAPGLPQPGFVYLGDGLERVSLTTGSSRDTIDVTPSPEMAFEVNVGAPLSQDVLRIHRIGVEGGVLTRNPQGSGSYTSSNRQPITFGATGAVQLVPALVVGRHVFYNNSAFDGGNAAANAADDAAIAPDKAALLPGQRATFSNVTSYSKGINGVILDIDSRGDGPPPGRADFQFSVRNRAASSGWVAAPEPSSITLRRGAGAGGSDRVTITWPDGAITNTWLRVTVLPTARTGLLGPDTFSIGNLVAETGAGNTAAALVVNSFDFSRTRAAMFSDATVTSRYDFNRDGRVSPIDLAISRSNQRRLLELFPSGPSGGPPSLAPAGVTNLLEEDFS